MAILRGTVLFAVFALSNAYLNVSVYDYLATLPNVSRFVDLVNQAGLDDYLRSKGSNSSIIQIAAKHQSTGDIFSCYMKPKTEIIPTAITNITGLEYHGSTMFFKSQPVACVNPSKGLQLFKDWLDKYQSPVLLAHNAQFDSRILVSSFESYGIDFPNISGFGDTLKLFRSEYPGRSSYRQEVLVADFIKRPYESHNAVEDVATLCELVNLVEDYLAKIHVFPVISVSLKLKRLNNEKKLYHMYTTLLEKTNMSKASAKALSGSGLTPDHLKLAYQRQGLDGLQSLIKTTVPRYKQLSLILQSEFEEKETAPITVLVPTNDAFNKFSNYRLGDLLADPRGALKRELQYHMIDQTLLTPLQFKLVNSTTGHPIWVWNLNHTCTFNQAHALQGDIMVSNGVVFLIDAVLDAPEGTDLQILGNPAYNTSIFLDYVKRAGFGGILGTVDLYNRRRYTVFAPTDAAFLALGRDTRTYIEAHSWRLNRLVQYHIHSGTRHTKYLQAGALSTMDVGHRIQITQSGSNETILDLDARIVIPDILADNGVVHVISHVLIPSNVYLSIVG